MAFEVRRQNRGHKEPNLVELPPEKCFWDGYRIDNLRPFQFGLRVVFQKVVVIQQRRKSALRNEVRELFGEEIFCGVVNENSGSFQDQIPKKPCYGLHCFLKAFSAAPRTAGSGSFAAIAANFRSASWLPSRLSARTAAYRTCVSSSSSAVVRRCEATGCFLRLNASTMDRRTSSCGWCKPFATISILIASILESALMQASLTDSCAVRRTTESIESFVPIVTRRSTADVATS